MNRMTLMGAGAGASASVDTTPLLVVAGTEVTITGGTSTAPRINTATTAPAGSVIVACVMTNSSASFSATPFSDGTNTYTADPTGPAEFINSSHHIQTFSTGPIASALTAGTAIGPNVDGACQPYMVVFCFPGATSKDPEAGAFNALGSGSPATVVVASNATQPQYAAFFVATTSQASGVNLTSTGTDLALQGAINSDFGIRGWVQKITTTGSSTTLTGTYPGGGGGVGWSAAQRTVKVPN